MPDLSLDPSTLSVIAPSLLTPSKLGNLSNSLSKAPKTTATAPRIDLEPIYTSLKATIGEHWTKYKEAVGLFVIGQLNQAEFCIRTDHFLAQDPAVEHLHNQLIVGVFVNAGRDPPEPGIASFVSANDKPVSLQKPLAGDAAEQRLKTEVMHLPLRDRKRLKEIAEAEIQDPISASVLEYQAAKYFKIPADAGSGGKTNWDLEIRKRFQQPLAAESGEFPDADSIQKRLVPICYEEGLSNGTAASCADFIATAAEQFIKEALSVMYNRSRINIPSGSVNSVMTHRFRTQLQAEEDAFLHGDVVKVAGTGLFPVEAKETSTRQPLGIHDLKIVINNGDSGLGQFQNVLNRISDGYEEGEYEDMMDQIKLDMSYSDEEPRHYTKSLPKKISNGEDVHMNGYTNGINGTNGHNTDIEDDDDTGWDGGSAAHRMQLHEALEECLNIGI